MRRVIGLGLALGFRSGGSKRRNLLIAGDGRRSFYDKKPQRYAEDNRTAFNYS